MQFADPTLGMIQPRLSILTAEKARGAGLHAYVLVTSSEQSGDERLGGRSRNPAQCL